MRSYPPPLASVNPHLRDRDHLGSRSAAAILIACAVLSVGLYVAVFVTAGRLHTAVRTGAEDLFPVSSLLLEAVAADGRTPAARHAAAAPPFLLLATALFLLYVVALAISPGRWTMRAIAAAVIAGGAFQVLALLSPWMLSTDVYSYAIYGRIFGVYHASPYVDVPAQYPGDPYLPHVFWKYAPSYYGPLWTILSGAAVRLAGEDAAVGVFALRMFAAASALGTALAVTAVAYRSSRDWALTAAVLVGWNPLTVIEGGLSGHNDLLMSFLTACGFLLLATGWPALAVGAILLAGLVKYVALAMIPLVVVFVVRTLQGWRARAGFVARAVLLSATLGWAVLAPTWIGPATLGVATLGAGSDRYTNSLAELVLGELRVLLGETREDTEVPLQFRGWWVATHRPAPLHSGRDERSELIATVEPWTELLVIGVERLGWMRVYAPDLERSAFVPSSAVGPIDRPTRFDDHAGVLARERGPSGSPATMEANRLIRLVGWGAFGAVWLAALVVGTSTLGGLARGWTAALLALFYLGSAWFWPWYVVWALVPAALSPAAAISRLVVLLSWGVLVLYVALGFGETDLWFLQTYRALAVFGAPVALFLLDGSIRWLAAWVRRSIAAAPPAATV